VMRMGIYLLDTASGGITNGINIRNNGTVARLRIIKEFYTKEFLYILQLPTQ
jgi:hypothetical protein